MSPDDKQEQELLQGKVTDNHMQGRLMTFPIAK